MPVVLLFSAIGRSHLGNPGSGDAAAAWLEHFLVNYGATMVYTGEGFDPLAVLGAIEAERCTALHGVPTMFIAWLDHPEFKKFDLSSLRTGIMGGAPGPIELIKRVVGEMHMSGVANAFGMTETGPTRLSRPRSTIRSNGGSPPWDGFIPTWRRK